MRPDPKILSVNISEKKGTIKVPVERIVLDEQGVQGDAHAGNWHRQVSLLGKESVGKFSGEAGRTIAFGEFAENITTEGLILYETHPLDRLKMGDVELEVTQIGKKCHGDSCAIFREVGNCVMPKEGIFARVVKGGALQPGQSIEYMPKIFHVLVITLSDRASAGEYTDRSGPRVVELIQTYFEKELKWKVELETIVIPDDPVHLQRLLEEARDNSLDLVFTTGGTGIGPRDMTPDVTGALLDKEIPGIMEMIRIKYGSDKPGALLARGVAGLMGNTLVFNLPGSVRAVNEYVPEITQHFRHLVMMLHEIDQH